jgi:hypothetical protein
MDANENGKGSKIRMIQVNVKKCRACEGSHIFKLEAVKEDKIGENNIGEHQIVLTCPTKGELITVSIPKAYFLGGGEKGRSFSRTSILYTGPRNLDTERD